MPSDHKGTQVVLCQPASADGSVQTLNPAAKSPLFDGPPHTRVNCLPALTCPLSLCICRMLWNPRPPRPLLSSLRLTQRGLLVSPGVAAEPLLITWTSSENTPRHQTHIPVDEWGYCCDGAKAQPGTFQSLKQRVKSWTEQNDLSSG